VGGRKDAVAAAGNVLKKAAALLETRLGAAKMGTLGYLLLLTLALSPEPAARDAKAG
jgi:hypothetical protein